MAYTINTQSAAYQNYLAQLQQIYALLRTNYGPIINRMNKAQLIQLYQNDPIFKEVVDMAKQINSIAERVDINL